MPNPGFNLGLKSYRLTGVTATRRIVQTAVFLALSRRQ